MLTARRPRFAVARWLGTSWREGRLGNTWEPLRGKRFLTLEKATAAPAQLARRHLGLVCAGRIAPNQLARFGETHRIVALEDGRYPAAERWLPTDIAAQPFSPGERLLWTRSPRHGHARVPVTVVRCAITRVLVAAPQRGSLSRLTWVSPDALERGDFSRPSPGCFGRPSPQARKLLRQPVVWEATDRETLRRRRSTFSTRQPRSGGPARLPGAGFCSDGLGAGSGAMNRLRVPLAAPRCYGGVHV